MSAVKFCQFHSCFLLCLSHGLVIFFMAKAYQGNYHYAANDPEDKIMTERLKVSSPKNVVGALFSPNLIRHLYWISLFNIPPPSIKSHWWNTNYATF